MAEITEQEVIDFAEKEKMPLAMARFSLAIERGVIPGDVIDPEQLAALQQRAIERMSENIDSDSIKTRKKIRITNTQNLNDLANEL